MMITITITGVRLHAIGAAADRHLPEVGGATGDEGAIVAALGAIRDRDPHRTAGDREDAVDPPHHAGVHGDVLVVSVDPGVDRPHHAEEDTIETETEVGMSTIVIEEDPPAVTGVDHPMITAEGGTTIVGVETITVLQEEVLVAAHIPTTTHTMNPTVPRAHGVVTPMAHTVEGADPRHTLEAVVAAIATAGTRAFLGYPYWCAT